MNKKSYSDLLRDPRWQKKRLEVLDKAGFKCEECGCDSDELHVHHCWYEKGKMPWEYSDCCFKCLCRECHGVRQKEELAIRIYLSQFDIGALSRTREALLCSIKLDRKKHG